MIKSYERKKQTDHSSINLLELMLETYSAFACIRNVTVGDLHHCLNWSRPEFPESTTHMVVFNKRFEEVGCLDTAPIRGLYLIEM